MTNPQPKLVDDTDQTPKSVRSQALSPTLSQGEREIGRTLHFQTEFANEKWEIGNGRFFIRLFRLS
jgi:hypothetical protein